MPICGMAITKMKIYNISNVHKYKNYKQNAYNLIPTYTYVFMPKYQLFRKFKIIIHKTFIVIYHLKNKIEELYDLLQRQRKHLVKFNNHL